MPLATSRTVTDPADCFFYHTMDLPGLGRVTGEWDLRGRFGDYIGRVDVRGKRVLDIGCASGYLSFSAEAAGAADVFSFDMDSPERQHLLPFRDSLYYSDHAQWARYHGEWLEKWKNAYWLAHRLLASRAKVFYGDVYDITTEHGQFDVVIIGSVLEHLSDPVRALASIARVTGKTLVITTAVLDTEEPIASFMGNRDKPDMNYVFWVYSIGAYRQVLGMLGFEIVRIEHDRFFANYSKQKEDRTVLVAERT